MAYKCRNTLLQRLENGEEVRVYEGGKTIKNATINDAIFRENCTLDHAVINNSIFNDVKLKHSIIKHCVLHYCVLEFCTASNSVLKHCQVIKSPLALRRFAPEIRMLIFDYVIEGHGKTPKLVKALRNDQVMYREALEVLYKKSPIPLSFAKKMSPGDIQFITKLVIEPEYNAAQVPLEVLANAKNIGELDLRWAKREACGEFLVRLAKILVLWFPNLQTVRKVHIMFPDRQSWWANPNYDSIVYKMLIDCAASRIGADLVTTVRYNSYYSYQVLEAKAGNVLRYNMDLK